MLIIITNTRCSPTKTSVLREKSAEAKVRNRYVYTYVYIYIYIYTYVYTYYAILYYTTYIYMYARTARCAGRLVDIRPELRAYRQESLHT